MKAASVLVGLSIALCSAGAWAAEPADSPAASPAPSQEPARAVGLRTRLVMIPRFMFGLFQADGGKTVLSPSVGPEYSVQKGNTEYIGWLTLSGYGMGDTALKAKSDPDQAYEIVRSELKTLTVGADVLWSSPLNQELSFVYGAGAGLGIVFGDLYRTQAYPQSGVAGEPDSYSKCRGPADPNPSYCGRDNSHYGNYSEASWFGGGSKPVVMPWLTLPQVGLRWKPSPKWTIRLDTGLSFPGPFFIGLAGQYGLL